MDNNEYGFNNMNGENNNAVENADVSSENAAQSAVETRKLPVSRYMAAHIVRHRQVSQHMRHTRQTIAVISTVISQPTAPCMA